MSLLICRGSLHKPGAIAYSSKKEGSQRGRALNGGGAAIKDDNNKMSYCGQVLTVQREAKRAAYKIASIF